MSRRGDAGEKSRDAALSTSERIGLVYAAQGAGVWRSNKDKEIKKEVQKSPLQVGRERKLLYFHQ